MEEKELVWLPKSLAERIKGFTDNSEYEAAIVKYIEESKADFKINIESIEEDVLQYKAFMIKAKNAFREAKEEQLNASYELWDKFDGDLSKVRDYVSRVRKEIEPLKKDIEQLNSEISKISKWEIEGLLKLLQEINGQMYGETANMIKFLFDNYKKEQP